MINPMKGEVLLDDLKLRLTISAMIAAEEAADVRLPAMLVQAEMTGGLGFRDVRLLLWAARLHEEPDWTLDDAAAVMEEKSFATSAIAVRAAIHRAFPPPSAEGKAKRQTRAAKASTG